MPDAAIKVRGLSKEYATGQGKVQAVDGIDFEVKDGHFFTLLGPSGCGKSTTLRCLAGLERPEAGDIAFGDEVVVSISNGRYIPAYRRPIGMVFQSYAIWPHMNVFDNVAFPLTQRRGKSISKREVKERVMRALDLVQLNGLEKRPAPQLSGGQQQRLALARAVVHEPKALLLDEPLSNLDARLRDEMRLQLKQLTQRIGITSVFVTHDQLEALTLSDQIAIMQNGKIAQIGTPHEIYSFPANRFAAQFIGTMNFLEGDVIETRDDGKTVVVKSEGNLIEAQTPYPVAGGPSTHVTLGIRPEDISISKTGGPLTLQEHLNCLEGKVETVVYLGDALDCHIHVGGQLFRASAHPSLGLQNGDDVRLTIPSQACKVIPTETTAAAPAR